MLIVDDSRFMQEIIKESFSDLNVEIVASAVNGKEAIKLFEEHRPSVITMDLTMPEMDGLTCIKEILKIDPSVYIFVITALADKATGLQALTLGAKKFFLKPIDQKKLKESFYKLLG